MKGAFAKIYSKDEWNSKKTKNNSLPTLLTSLTTLTLQLLLTFSAHRINNFFMKVIFFNYQLQEFIQELPKQSSAKTGRLIDLLELFGNNLTMPYSKQLDDNLYELRARGQQEIRILYCYKNNNAVIVHIFIKKTQKTPRKEIKIALKRISLLK